MDDNNLHYLYFENSHILNFIYRRFLSLSYLNSAGRNLYGRITVYHRASKPYTNYPLIDRSRNFFVLCPGICLSIKYLKYRFLNLICYDNGYISLIPAVEGVKSGDLILVSQFPFIRLGAVLKLGHIPAGLAINSVCFFYSSLKNFSTASGTYSKILTKRPQLSIVELPSKEKRLVFSMQGVILGRNKIMRLQPIFKAGITRLLGWRPVVRGVAMNPIDHPHGGGQGKTSGGQPSVSPWGIYTKGQKTSRSTSKFRIRGTRRLIK